ncbi:XRE family transcriptional regulator [Brachybacterium sp.]|uniref:helix-turn-helix domain-containing protein n=1 Tax=Brachybacterium sp. TaxID=1891286 RepID=UPI002ED6BA84
MTTIGGRVRAAMRGAGMQQKELAERVGMTPDALSRALSDQRGFAAVELASIAIAIGADVHELITGDPDPHRLILSARHAVEHDTGARRVDGLEEDAALLTDVRRAYAQAGTVPESEPLPADVEHVQRLLPEGFVRGFIDHLALLGVDVVCIENLSTACSAIIEARPVILVPATGNWFSQNWSLAQELGHLVLGHEGVVPGAHGSEAREREAHRFAADLLLPAEQLRETDWLRAEAPAVAELVWVSGVSTEALRRRLGALGLEPSSATAEALTWTTQKLLRRTWAGATVGDPISERMDDAGRRRFPGWLREAHLERIAEGAVGKGTLAWMLGVPAESLEVDEPERGAELSDDDTAHTTPTTTPTAEAS